MTTTMAEARDNLPELWDKVTQNREIVFLHRSGADDVALIAADELDSLLETAYLLRSPSNARRLFSALQRARAGDGTLQTAEQLRADFGLTGRETNGEANLEIDRASGTSAT